MWKHKQPLVSILIPNRNHSKFLGSCIESALCQTYKNIEIIVNDNCSDDSSLEVTMKYLDKGVIVNKNPINILSKNYRVLANLASGKYFMMLCADDMIKPEFIEKAVNIMEKYNNIGYVHCERDYIDHSNRITELDYFFNCSFMCPGEEMLPIYMYAEVGQAAQGLIRKSAFDSAGCHDTEVEYANIEKEQWFRLSMVSDYAYIREKLALIRIFDNSETAVNTNLFLNPTFLYCTLKHFLNFSKLNGYTKVLEREESAFKKFAQSCLNMAITQLKIKNFNCAKQYLLFSQIIDDNIINNPKFKMIDEMCRNKKTNNDVFAYDDNYIKRNRNYDPPVSFSILQGV